ncbi:parvalbumin 9 isoform X1 [Cyprinodon tularosa]|uniref:parvalbumin 9 isoform X1 n=1 Tax=Cyprinodon tularosa TaxID=77115 RepID=UPI0018E1EB91|nr:parvalbumin 9 isoform X1 [Cyprinodon tularosa]
MSLTNILKPEDIKKAVDTFEAVGSFKHKEFFKICGLSTMPPEKVREVFRILDGDNSGYLEESELKDFLKWFNPEARTLTEEEIRFVLSGDENDDGKIGEDEFLEMVKS